MSPFVKALTRRTTKTGDILVDMSQLSLEVRGLDTGNLNCHMSFRKYQWFSNGSEQEYICPNQTFRDSLCDVRGRSQLWIFMKAYTAFVRGDESTFIFNSDNVL